MTLHASILTLFPEMFPGTLGHSLAGRALEEGRWSYEAINLRDFALDKHQSVDDTPYGGGAGMVMRPDVVGRAMEHTLEQARQKQPETPPRILYMSPRGKQLTQKTIKSLVDAKNLVILCGRFEGVDQRVIDHFELEEISIGDYVLSGGEPAAMILLDACIRLLPGVMGGETSAEEESFATGDGPFSGLLEYPHYTKPANWQGLEIPEILRSGHHAKVDEWRLEQAKKLTQTRRPDLWQAWLAKQARWPR